MSAAAANVYGEIRAVLEAKGETIGGNDLWIAARCYVAPVIL
jgi:tRNA(fMet)-specific endonuclease VapC